MPAASNEEEKELLWRLRESRWSLLAELDRHEEVLVEFEPLREDFERFAVEARTVDADEPEE